MVSAIQLAPAKSNAGEVADQRLVWLGSSGLAVLSSTAYPLRAARSAHLGKADRLKSTKCSKARALEL